MQLSEVLTSQSFEHRFYNDFGRKTLTKGLRCNKNITATSGKSCYRDRVRYRELIRLLLLFSLKCYGAYRN